MGAFRPLPARAKAIVSSESTEHKSALVLVVERDPWVRELEEYFLTEAGFAVEFAANGEQALEQIRLASPEVVITEVLVPGVDGLALCRKIRQDPATRDAAVVVFSFLTLGDRAAEAGADAFLRKPLSDRKLVDTVRGLLEERSARSSTQATTRRSDDGP